MTSLEIKGLKELQEKLAKLKGVSPHSLLAGALLIQRYAMENAPVKTGFLRNSAISRETPKGAEVAFQANYAFYVEYGTKKMSAQPFLRPAIDEHPQEITNVVSDQIKKDIEGRL